MATICKSYNNTVKIFFRIINIIAIKQNYLKKELVSEILSFKSLENNWDGFGTIPLEVESAVNVITLIDLIGENLSCTIGEIFPNPNGTISLIWNNQSNETISIEVGNGSLSFYVALSSHKTLFFNDIKINSEESGKISKFIELLQIGKLKNCTT